MTCSVGASCRCSCILHKVCGVFRIPSASQLPTVLCISSLGTIPQSMRKICHEPAIVGNDKCTFSTFQNSQAPHSPDRGARASFRTTACSLLRCEQGGTEQSNPPFYYPSWGPAVVPFRGSDFSECFFASSGLKHLSVLFEQIHNSIFEPLRNLRSCLIWLWFWILAMLLYMTSFFLFLFIKH